MNEVVIGCSSIGISTTIEGIVIDIVVVCVGWVVVVVTIIIGIPEVTTSIDLQEPLFFRMDSMTFNFFSKMQVFTYLVPLGVANLLSHKNVKLVIICFGYPCFNIILNNDQTICAEKGNLLLDYRFPSYPRKSLL